MFETCGYEIVMIINQSQDYVCASLVGTYLSVVVSVLISMFPRWLSGMYPQLHIPGTEVHLSYFSLKDESFIIR